TVAGSRSRVSMAAGTSKLGCSTRVAVTVTEGRTLPPLLPCCAAAGCAANARPSATAGPRPEAAAMVAGLEADPGRKAGLDAAPNRPARLATPLALRFIAVPSSFEAPSSGTPADALQAGRSRRIALRKPPSLPAIHGFRAIVPADFAVVRTGVFATAPPRRFAPAVAGCRTTPFDAEAAFGARCVAVSARVPPVPPVRAAGRFANGDRAAEAAGEEVADAGFAAPAVGAAPSDDAA